MVDVEMIVAQKSYLAVSIILINTAMLFVIAMLVAQ